MGRVSKLATTKSATFTPVDINIGECVRLVEFMYGSFIYPFPRRTRKAALRGQRPSRRGTSKYKGVSIRRDINRWLAMITLNDKNYFLGHYDDEKQAALAYDKAALLNFGDDALTNQMYFPEDFKE